MRENVKMAVINLSIYLKEDELLEYVKKKKQCNDSAREAFKKELNGGHSE